MMERIDQSRYIVQQFWEAMETNNFRFAADLLHEDFLLEWPQTGERIRGPLNFALLNENYPASGKWHFDVQRLVAQGDEVVTDVLVSDGVVTGRAITFSTIRSGRIWRQVEYWPDPGDPPAWRSQWVELG